MPQRTFGYIEPNREFQFHPDSLYRHFDTHKNKFNGIYTTAKQYEKGAIRVIREGEAFDSIHESKPVTIFYKQFIDSTYHFVATVKSTILTYHTREKHQIDSLQRSKEQKPATRSNYFAKVQSSNSIPENLTTHKLPHESFLVADDKNVKSIDTEIDNKENVVVEADDSKKIVSKRNSYRN